MRRHFAEERSPEGRPWKRWKTGYRSRSGKILGGSHRLRNAIRARPGAKHAEAGIYEDIPYARIHDSGGTTSPHIIEPVEANVLAFRVRGKKVFAKSVNHPGSVIPKRRYIGISKLTRERIDKVFARHMKRASSV
jgi:phage gpG-like protein